MGNLTVALTFVMFMNVLMFMAQAAILELNPTNPTIAYHCEGSLLDSSLVGSNCENLTTIDTANLTGIFPVTSRTISEDTGFGFVDVFTTMTNWFTEKIDYTLAITSGPMNALESIPGLPSNFVKPIGFLWYGITIFLIVAFIAGKD